VPQFIEKAHGGALGTPLHFLRFPDRIGCVQIFGWRRFGESALNVFRFQFIPIQAKLTAEPRCGAVARQGTSWRTIFIEVS
jgi:hypothetical protein